MKDKEIIVFIATIRSVVVIVVAFSYYLAGGDDCEDHKCISGASFVPFWFANDGRQQVRGMESVLKITLYHAPARPLFAFHQWGKCQGIERVRSKLCSFSFANHGPQQVRRPENCVLKIR